MKTDELIRVLSADRLAPATPVGRLIATAMLGGTMLAAILFTVMLDTRPNAVESLGHWRFIMKFVVTLGLALPAAALLFRLARPVEDLAVPWWLLLFAPLALITCVAGELLLVPASAWPRRLVGANAIHCLTLIPVLSIAPAACLFAALKRGAPAHPSLAGAVCGLTGAGIGAAFYALNCPDDSPLFVATWYVLAIGIVTLICRMIGARVLRW